MNMVYRDVLGTPRVRMFIEGTLRKETSPQNKNVFQLTSNLKGKTRRPDPTGIPYN